MQDGFIVRGAALLPVCAVLLTGCPGSVTFQDEVDSACLGPDWIADAAEAIDVEPDTFEQVLRHVVHEVPLLDGNWAEDFGDAHLYGPAVLLGLGHEIDSPCLLAFGRASQDGNRRVIRMGQRCRSYFWRDPQAQVMAAYGLVETYQHERRADDPRLIDGVLDRVNSTLQALDLYPDELPDSLLSLYGPTTYTAALASLNLRYASQFGGPRSSERRDFALQLVDVLDQRAYEPQRGIYRFSDEAPELYLYPNTATIIANCLAYQATGAVHYLERARRIFESIQPLKDSARGNYRSPYSAGMQGATTEDYSTLSSQLYLITALCLLYETTGLEQYQREARDVLHFVCTHLHDDGRLVHHWIDGRRARPDDRDYYCSGCNLQALYVMWYVTHLRPTSAVQP